jgi:hypothetical protein
MSGIEERYRFVLRLLPASYRQRWEEDMVAAFLESVTPDDPEEAEFVRDYGRPSWPEVFSVVGLALRLRLAHAGAPPRYLVWAQAVRLAALGWMFLNAVAGATSLGFHLWLVGAVPGVAAPMNGEFLLLGTDHWVTASVVIGLLWVPAYLALLLADSRVGRALVTLAVIADSGLLLASTGRGDPVGGTIFVRARGQRTAGPVADGLPPPTRPGFGPGRGCSPCRSGSSSGHLSPDDRGADNRAGGSVVADLAGAVLVRGGGRVDRPPLRTAVPADGAVDAGHW